MTILICGDRHWKSPDIVASCIKEYMPELILHGSALDGSSINLFAQEIARGMGIPEKIADEFGDRPNLVLAFHNFINGSKTTKAIVNEAKRNGIAVRIVTEKEFQVRSETK